MKIERHSPPLGAGALAVLTGAVLLAAPIAAPAGTAVASARIVVPAQPSVRTTLLTPPDPCRAAC